MPSQSEKATDQPHKRVPAVFLNNLDVELPFNPRLVELSILAQSLFSRQVCLTDSQLIDNVGVRRFFLKNKDSILESVQEADLDEVPLLATCGRGAGNCDHSLLALLEPRGERRLPPAFTSFAPQQNAALRKGYASLSAERRRDRFYRLAGTEFGDYTETANSYFLRCPEKTVLEGTKKKETRLFPLTKVLLDVGLEGPYQNFPTDKDREICARIREVISGAKGERNRERLHGAVYGGEDFPQVYEGKVQWENFGREPDTTADGWRFLINHIYNLDLADSFGLRRGVNSSGYQTGFPKALASQINRRKVGEMVVPARIHTDFLTFDFVRALRKREQFWSTLQRMESSPKEHLILVSEAFARHLVDAGRRDLVGREVLDITDAAFDAAKGIVGPGLFAIAIALGQPIDTAAWRGCGAMGAVNQLRWAVRKFFSSELGPSIGRKWEYREEFSNFVQEVSDLARKE